MRAHTRIPLYAKKQIDLPDPPGTFLIAVRAPTPSSNVEDDVDGTGQDLWDASVVLSRWLAKHADLLAGKRVLELGAGVGLPGLVACRLGAHVTLTDYDPGALQLLQHNIKENIQSRSCGTEPSVCKLDFTDSSSTTSCGQHDIILAADVAYVSRTAEPLTDCMSTLCQDPHGLVLMGHQVRKSVSMDRNTGQVVMDEQDEPLEAFLAAMRSRGFHAHLLHSTDPSSAVDQANLAQQLPIQVWGFCRDENFCSW